MRKVRALLPGLGVILLALLLNACSQQTGTEGSCAQGGGGCGSSSASCDDSKPKCRTGYTYDESDGKCHKRYTN